MNSFLSKSMRILLGVVVVGALIGLPLFWYLSENTTENKNVQTFKPANPALPNINENVGGGQSSRQRAQNSQAQNNQNSLLPPSLPNVQKNAQNTVPQDLSAQAQELPAQPQALGEMPNSANLSFANEQAINNDTSAKQSPNTNLSPQALNKQTEANKNSASNSLKQNPEKQTPEKPNASQSAAQNSKLSNTAKSTIDHNNVVVLDMNAGNAPDSAPNLSYEPSNDTEPEAGVTKVPFEDSVVRIGFIDDFAHTLVNNYWPKGTHPAAAQSGVALLSLKSLNMRYGSNLKGLSWGKLSTNDSGDLVSARANILNYVLSPSMINGLAKVYSDPLVEAMQREAQKIKRKSSTGKAVNRALSKAEIAEMYTIYSKKMRGVSAVLASYAAHPELATNAREYANAVNKANEVQAKFIMAAQEHEQAINSNNSKATQTTSKNLAALNIAYQESNENKDTAKLRLVNSVRNTTNTSLDDDSIIYQLIWAQRHATPENGRLPAIKTAADTLTQLASSFEKKASQNR